MEEGKIEIPFELAINIKNALAFAVATCHDDSHLDFQRTRQEFLRIFGEVMNES